MNELFSPLYKLNRYLVTFGSQTRYEVFLKSRLSCKVYLSISRVKKVKAAKNHDEKLQSKLAASFSVIVNGPYSSFCLKTRSRDKMVTTFFKNNFGVILDMLSVI